jgi:hypothetical protein
LALLAGFGLLAAVQLASVVDARSAGDRAVCLDNLRQLSRAWMLYAEENRGAFAGNLDGGSLLSRTNETWAVGWLTLDTVTTDNTNWAALMRLQLGPYARSHQIYRCPADNSLGPVPGMPSLFQWNAAGPARLRFPLGGHQPHRTRTIMIDDIFQHFPQNVLWSLYARWSSSR